MNNEKEKEEQEIIFGIERPDMGPPVSGGSTSLKASDCLVPSSNPTECCTPAPPVGICS